MGQLKMWKKKRLSKKEWISLILVYLLLIGGGTYYVLFYTPKDSLELYQGITFADDFDEAQRLMLEGYEGNFSEEDFDFINDMETSARSVGQFTLFEYNDRSYIISTSPGTDRLKVLKVEELPEEIRDYFLNFEDDPSQ